MKLLWPLAFMVLGACAPDHTRMAVSAQAAAGQLAYGAPVLAAARMVFFGPGGGASDGESGGGGSGGGGGGLLSPADPVRLRGMPPSVLQLSLTREDALGGGSVLRSSAMLGYQHLHGTLPQGLGILTDPLQIDIWAQALGLQVALGHTVALPAGLHLDYQAGLGLTRLAAATRLQSALIDVRGRSLQVLPYAVAEGQLAGRTGPALSGGVWVFHGGATELRFGVAQSF